MWDDRRAIVKFNGGALALLCSKCSVIMKTGREFTRTELNYALGKSKKILPPQYCESCKNKQNDKR